MRKNLSHFFIPFIVWISTCVSVFAQTDSLQINSTDTISVVADSLKLPNTQTSPFNSEVRYKAKDSIYIDIPNKTVFLYGDAEVYYEKIVLKAAVVWLDFNTNLLRAYYILDSAGNKVGIPHFEDDGSPYDADSMKYNFSSKRAVVSYVKIVEGDGFVYGDKVSKDENNNIYVKDAKYTTCDAPHPHFYIGAHKIKIIPGKQIVTGPANIYIADVPTPLFVPFGFFPISNKDRHSGILFPTYGFDQYRGYKLTNGGYYFAISDYLDLALTADFYTYGSYGFNGVSSYNKRYKYSGNVALNYAFNEFGFPEDPSYRKEKNFRIAWNHSQDPKSRPNTTFRASVDFSSSNYLQLNSNNSATIPQSSQNSSVAYGKVFNNGRQALSVNLEHRQNNQTKQVEFTLPQVNFDIPRFFPFAKQIPVGKPLWYEKIGVQYGINARNRISTYDSILFEDIDKRMSNGASQRAVISSQFSVFKWLNINPSFSSNQYLYAQTISKRYDPTIKAVKTDTIHGFSQAIDYQIDVPLTTVLYGMYSFNSKKLKAIRHVITPAITASYRPDFSDPKYNYFKIVQADSANTRQETYSIYQNGVIGGPSGGKSGLVSFNLNNVLEGKTLQKTDTGITENKVKLIDRLSLGTSYNFFLDSVKWAPLRIDLNTSLFKRINIQTGVSYSIYGTDSLGRPIEKYYKETNGKLLRNTDGFVRLSTSLNQDILNGKKSVENPQTNATNTNIIANPNTTAYELAMLQNAGKFVDFNVPWNLNVNYNISYTKVNDIKTVSQTVLFNGDISLTENWKIGATSGYDFTRKEVNLTSIDFYRQLHCWEFRLNWIPTGLRKSFSFSINVKSSTLKDLKVNRNRNYWFDAN